MEVIYICTNETVLTEKLYIVKENDTMINVITQLLPIEERKKLKYSFQYKSDAISLAVNLLKLYNNLKFINEWKKK